MIAALQETLPVVRRRTIVRRKRSLMASCAIPLAVLLLAGAAEVVSISSAEAQGYSYNPRPPRARPPQSAKDGQMLVQATEVNYDYNNQRVSAVGNVQMFFNGTTVEADRLVYDQNTKRLRAEGNVRMTDATGKITYANMLDLSDDYRDGFVDSLRVDTAEDTRIAASRADRTNGDFNVFQNGVYTACAPCRDNPKKPPLWQVKGARIIHDQVDKMLYFENAQLEFFGVPMAYLPYFATPDPTVKRKTGFLMPFYTTNTTFGMGFEVPFYWALAPDYDVTITPRITTKQGVLMQGEFRQQLLNGAYQIRAYGINQSSPSTFAGQPGERDFRGGVDTKGEFALNDKWVFGWEGVLLSDRAFFLDYRLSQYRDSWGTFLNQSTEATSQIYLTGVGNRSYFDLRAIHYLGWAAADIQGQIPIVHPVLDYSKTIDRNIFGGEVSFKTNLTSLSRQTAQFDPITTIANTSGLCLNTSADPAARMPSSCLLRGVPGTYTRVTAEATWRRSFTDPYGQIWTPFASLRADAIDSSVSNQPGVSSYLPVGDTQAFRVMPTVGLEYRYPFINVQPWGTTTIEPIAQVIIRPNETYAGKLPNEDAQTMVFDTSNLFSVDKFSGYDRVEGGGRANVGVQATTQFDRGGAINVLFGQSYQLFGQNSFAVKDITNTGLDSGLATTRSDYVGRVSYSPNSTYKFTTRARFDEATMAVNRFEAEASASFNRWSVSMIYGSYAAQPELGFLTRRQGILTTGSIKVASNWVVSGGARWDLEANRINQYIVGAGYVDDCFVMALNYVTGYAYSNYGTAPTLNHSVMVQIGLRTIGMSAVAQSVSSGSSGSLFGQ
ncbi:MAG: LPS-assembly protein LptD [Rhodopseudomonas palustris]|uniref:LPS-assembly protein LptD n=1 Tax=Rhodopseudomonas palustris TaxID=1076 RepID=A0A933W3F9_RHOPL|nr:LPS-assembly protein LptD [Rhodopseudomonas palustris]